MHVNDLHRVLCRDVQRSEGEYKLKSIFAKQATDMYRGCAVKLPVC